MMFSQPVSLFSNPYHYPYVLTVHVPNGFRVISTDVGGRAAEIADKGKTATAHIVPSATKEVEW